jgi:transposase
MQRASREVWEKRVEAWLQSGLSYADFAAKEGISAGTLRWWKGRLRKSNRQQQPQQRIQAGRSRTAAVSPVTFVEMAALSRGEQLEIVLPTGVRVRVPIDFDAVALGRLLVVLGERR